MPEQISEMNRVVRVTQASRVASKIWTEYCARATIYAQKDKHVAWGMVGIPTELLLLFDVPVCWPENFGAVAAAHGAAVHFLEIAEADGYASELCSYLRVGAGYCKEFMDGGGLIPALSPKGGMPRPTMLLTNSYICDPRIKVFQAYASRFLHVPIFIQDIPNPPYGTDLSDQRIKKYHVEHYLSELKRLVAFLEEVTGRKYDESRFREIMVVSQETERLLYEVVELRKIVPCPLPSEDCFTSLVLIWLYMMGEDQALEFARQMYAEVKERANNKVGVIPVEQYRIATMGIPPWYCLGVFNYMESQGIVGVMDGNYYRGEPLEMDLSEPLHALAEKIWLRCAEAYRHGDCANSPEPASSGPSGTVPAGRYLEWIDSFKLDGVLIFYTRSCRAVSIGQTHARRRLMEVGIPSLVLNVDMADPRQWSDLQIKEQINSFRDLMETTKKNGRKYGS